MEWALKYLLASLEFLLGSVVFLFATGIILLTIVAISVTKKELKGKVKTNKIEKEGQNNGKDKNKPE